MFSVNMKWLPDELVSVLISSDSGVEIQIMLYIILDF